MELKINLDTNTVAKQMVVLMMQTLHNSVVSFAHQKFGAINPQAGALPFPAAGPGMSQYPGQPPVFQGLFQQLFNGFPQPGHPYAPYGAPPAPYAPAHAQSQQPPTNGDQSSRSTGHSFTPVTTKSEYHNLMDALCADPELVRKVEAALCKHLEEFVGMKSDDKPAA